MNLVEEEILRAAQNDKWLKVSYTRQNLKEPPASQLRLLKRKKPLSRLLLLPKSKRGLPVMSVWASPLKRGRRLSSLVGEMGRNKRAIPPLPLA
jgi:hypothetical protein